MDHYTSPTNRPESPVPKRKVPFVDGVNGMPSVTDSDAEGVNHHKHARRALHDMNLPSLRENECELLFDIASMVSDVDALEFEESEQVVRVERSSTCAKSGRLDFQLVVFLSKHQDAGYSIGLYVRGLEPAAAGGSEWFMRGVSFMVMLVNAADPYSLKSKVSTDSCTFSSSDPCRGWPRLVSFSSISELEADGFLLDGSLMMARAQASFDGCEIVQSEQKYLGLENQGATCYLNGLLQSLYHIGHLKEIIYSVSEDDPSVLTALQTVFFDLEKNPRNAAAASSEPLTEAFGWSSVDVGVQHDVQEMNRLLVDRLESRLEISRKDKLVKNLFCGKIENFITCTDIDFKSVREEDFYDIQLNLVTFDHEGRRQQISSIQEALNAYLAVEVLEGTNAYDAGENRGKQRAEKGVRFVSLPPILTFQLMRFQFDFESLEMAKIFSKFEFTENLEIDNQNFRLYSVLVHAGGVNGGHYYAYIKPEQQWFKFDDSIVEPVDSWCAVDNNFGGPIERECVDYLHETPAEAREHEKQFSAYMLMYVRENMAADVLKAVRLEDVNPNLESVLTERCRRIAPVRTSRRVSVASNRSIAVRVMENSAELFSHPAASVEDFSASKNWFQNFSDISPFPVSDQGTLLSVPCNESIADLITAIAPKASNSPPVYVWVSQNEKLRLAELDLSDPELGQETVERLQSTVAADRNEPVVLWFADRGERKSDSDLVFVILKFDAEKQQLAFEKVALFESKTAFSDIVQLGGDGRVYALVSGTALLPLTEEMMDDGLIIVHQIGEGEVDAQKFFDQKLNIVENINLIVHDFAKEPWRLGGVPATVGGLICRKDGSTIEEIATEVIHVDSIDRRAPMTELAAKMSQTGHVMMFGDNPFDTEVKAGPNLCKPPLAVKDALVSAGSKEFHCVVLNEESGVFVRVFDESVVGTASCFVPCNASSTIAELMRRAREQLGLPEEQKYRIVEVDPFECEIASVFVETDSMPMSALLCWGAGNIFQNPLRIEPADDESEHLHCFHIDKSSKRPFGHPFILSLPADMLSIHSEGGKTARETQMRELLATKLKVPASVVRGWRLMEQDGKLMITHPLNPGTVQGTPQEKALFIKG